MLGTVTISGKREDVNQVHTVSLGNSVVIGYSAGLVGVSNSIVIGTSAGIGTGNQPPIWSRVGSFRIVMKLTNEKEVIKDNSILIGSFLCVHKKDEMENYYFDNLPIELNTEIFYYLPTIDRNKLRHIKVDYIYLILSKYKEFYVPSIVNYDTEKIYNFLEDFKHKKSPDVILDGESACKYFIINKYAGYNQSVIAFIDDVELFKHCYTLGFDVAIPISLRYCSHNIVKYLMEHNKLKDMYIIYKNEQQYAKYIEETIYYEEDNISHDRRNKMVNLLINFYIQSNIFLFEVLYNNIVELSRDNILLILDHLRDTDATPIQKVMYKCLSAEYCIPDLFMLLYNTYRNKLNKFQIGSYHSYIEKLLKENLSEESKKYLKGILQILYEDM